MFLDEIYQQKDTDHILNEAYGSVIPKNGYDEFNSELESKYNDAKDNIGKLKRLSFKLFFMSMQLMALEENLKVYENPSRYNRMTRGEALKRKIKLQRAISAGITRSKAHDELVFISKLESKCNDQLKKLGEKKKDELRSKVEEQQVDPATDKVNAKHYNETIKEVIKSAKFKKSISDINTWDEDTNIKVLSPEMLNSSSIINANGEVFRGYEYTIAEYSTYSGDIASDICATIRECVLSINRRNAYIWDEPNNNESFVIKVAFKYTDKIMRESMMNTPASIFAADNERIAYQRALRDDFSVVDYIQGYNSESVDMKVFGKQFLKNLRPDRVSKNMKLAGKGLQPKNVKKAINGAKNLVH